MTPGLSIRREMVPARQQEEARSACPVAVALEGGVEVVEQLSQEWRELCDRDGAGEPFYRPEWITATLRAFMPRVQLVVVVVRVDGRLRAVLPLVKERSSSCGAPVNKLRSPTSLHSGRFNLISAAADVDEPVIEAIWMVLKRTSGWDVVDFEHVPKGSAIERLLHVAQSDGYPAGTEERNAIPYISLTDVGGCLEAVLTRTKAKFRSNMRSRMRKLEEHGPVQLVRVDRADPVALDAFYRLEERGWKGQEGTAIMCDARVRSFYDEIAVAAEHYGYLSLYFLRCGERIVAAHFGLTYAGRYYAHKVAYDEQYKIYGPGQLIVQEVLRDVLRRGLTEFDFIGPWAEWKAEWTSTARRHTRHLIFHRGLVGRALHAAMFPLRDVAREVKRRLQHLRAVIGNATLGNTRAHTRGELRRVP